jgi:hypothetical protein
MWRRKWEATDFQNSHRRAKDSEDWKPLHLWMPARNFLRRFQSTNIVGNQAKTIVLFLIQWLSSRHLSYTDVLEAPILDHEFSPKLHTKVTLSKTDHPAPPSPGFQLWDLDILLQREGLSLEKSRKKNRLLAQHKPSSKLDGSVSWADADIGSVCEHDSTEAEAPSRTAGTTLPDNLTRVDAEIYELELKLKRLKRSKTEETEYTTDLVCMRTGMNCPQKSGHLLNMW